jgi:hypothetical protein
MLEPAAGILPLVLEAIGGFSEVHQIIEDPQ